MNHFITLRLFIQLFLIQLLLVVLGYIGLIFFSFFCFGSGARASSDQAEQFEYIWMMVLVELPLLFGVFKYYKTKAKEKAHIYLYAGLSVTAFTSIMLFLA